MQKEREFLVGLQKALGLSRHQTLRQISCGKAMGSIQKPPDQPMGEKLKSDSVYYLAIREHE